MFPTSHRSLRALAIAAAALLAGCADPTRPVTSGAALTTRAASVDARYYAIARPSALAAPAAATALITPAGGVLELASAGLRVSFPAGAVSADVRVTVRTASTSRVAYDFEPHGLVFSAPVQVHQVVGAAAIAAAPATPLLATYVSAGLPGTTDGGHLADEVLPVSLDAAAGTASFAIRHFSGYQLASGRTKR